MRDLIEYYEVAEGIVVKQVQSKYVYRYRPTKRVWEVDYALSALFLMDGPFGEPCENLRRRVDVSCDLPLFPAESQFQPGNTVLIGAYPQRSLHDFSPIEWIVLETDGTTALCISKYGLLPSGYCDPQQAYGKPELLWWENSLARDICIHHFLDTAFSTAEKRKLVRKKIPVQLGAVCKDRVFLLSEQEVLHYFPEASQRKVMPTPYALQKGAALGLTNNTRAYTGWWLLPEENAYGYQDGSIYPKIVFPMGEIQFHGRNVYHTGVTIRPCIQIRYRD